MFLVKCIICILSFVFFLAGGILLLLSGSLFVKDIPAPFQDLRRVSQTGLIICGIVLLLAALVALITAIAYCLVLPKDAGKTRMGEEEAKEIGSVVPKEEERSEASEREARPGEFHPEKLYMKQTETILQVIPDPLAKWDGTGLYPLLETMHVDDQGELKFPPRRPLDDTQIQK